MLIWKRRNYLLGVYTWKNKTLPLFVKWSIFGQLYIDLKGYYKGYHQAQEKSNFIFLC